MQIDDIHVVRKTLRDGIAKGYWTLEQLDKPSAGWIANSRVDRRTFPGGYEGVQHRNLLRDYHSETVEKGPDPRDFTPETDPSPEF